jgi:hypothetical protein
MNAAERAAIEALFFGGVPEGRVTRAVRIQSADLSVIPRKEQEVAETAEQLGYRAAYQVGTKKAPIEWHGYYGDRAVQIGDLRAERIEKKSEGDEEGTQDLTIIVKVTTSDQREVFLRSRGQTDSYGDNTSFGPFQIVKPREVTTIVYE